MKEKVVVVVVVGGGAGDVETSRVLQKFPITLPCLFRQSANSPALPPLPGQVQVKILLPVYFGSRVNNQEHAASGCVSL